MYGSPFEIGSKIEVKPFLHAPPLVVEILSAESFDHGGSANIFKGLVKVPYRPYEVALKVISHVMSKDRSELVRRELEVVSRLSEQSMRRILPFIGTSSIGFHPIIVMEYMKNGNMVQYFRKKPTADRQQLVSEAVYWLHDFKNLVHGDLKGENILINDNEDAVLADFGLATLIEQEASSVTTCTEIRHMNTLRFAAPELLGFIEVPEGAMRPRSKTPQSDVYAFGMLILQAFTGKHPWPHLARNEHVLVALMTRSTHPRPSEDVTQVGLTETWWEVCQRCWRYEPNDRPTMHQVWDMLRVDWRDDKGAEHSEQYMRHDRQIAQERETRSSNFSACRHWASSTTTADNANPTSVVVSQQRARPLSFGQLPPPHLPAAQPVHPLQNPPGGPVWQGKINCMKAGSLVTVVQVVAFNPSGNLCYDAWPEQLRLMPSKKRFSPEELGSWAKRNTPALCVVATPPNITGKKDEMRFKELSALLASNSAVALSHIPVPNTVHGINLVFFSIIPNLACAAFVNRPVPEIDDSPPSPRLSSALMPAPAAASAYAWENQAHVLAHPRNGSSPGQMQARQAHLPTQFLA